MIRPSGFYWVRLENTYGDPGDWFPCYWNGVKFENSYVNLIVNPSRIHPPKSDSLTLNGIIDIVSDFVRFDILKNTDCRYTEYVRARQIAHYAAHHYNVATLKEIGKRIGGKNHATVLNSVIKINNFIETDKPFVLKYKELFRTLNIPI